MFVLVKLEGWWLNRSKPVDKTDQPAQAKPDNKLDASRDGGGNEANPDNKFGDGDGAEATRISTRAC